MLELAHVQTDEPTPKKEPEPTVHVRIGLDPHRHRPMKDRSQTVCGKPIVGYYAPLDEEYDDLCQDGCFGRLELEACARRAAERDAAAERAEREHERESQQRLRALQDDHDEARRRIETATERMRRLEREQAETTDTATDPTRAESDPDKKP